MITIHVPPSEKKEVFEIMGVDNNLDVKFEKCSKVLTIGSVKEVTKRLRLNMEKNVLMTCTDDEIFLMDLSA